MRTKQLAIMIAAAAVLGAGAYFVNQSSRGGTSGGGGGAGAKVIELPVNEVAGIRLQSASGSVALGRKDDRWVVEDRAGYPANFEQVHDLLTKLWDLKTVQEVKAGASQFGRLELAEPLAGAGLKIEFKDQGGQSLGTLLLGKMHVKEGGSGFGGGGFPVGRYVLQPASQRVSLISETLEELEAKPEAWLARDFFRVENPSVVTLLGTSETQKWKLTRESATADWKLEGAKPEEKLDAGKISALTEVWANPTFADVLAPDVQPAETGLDHPAVMTIETFDGLTYVLNVGKEAGENQPVTVEISANLAKARTPGKDEKPEDKNRLDQEFKDRRKALEEKLAAEKKFEGRPFLFPKAMLDSVVLERAALLVPPAAPEPKTPTTPPGASKPVEAVTPPVTLPPNP